MCRLCEFEILKGTILSNIENINNEEIIFTLVNGEKYKLYHYKDCCESVTVEDIVGDFEDIISSPILLAEEVCYTNEDNDEDLKRMGIVKEKDESSTWTFYKLSTIKGNVTIRWWGVSNGWYSESVSFEKMKSVD